MTCAQPAAAGSRTAASGMLLITMAADQVESGRGYATTAHGDLISVPRAMTLVGHAMSVRLDPSGGVMSYGRTKRLVPPEMRLALTARDRGCTFPGCDRPPGWAEAHHLVAWADGGETSIENCALVCGYHHREFALRGWRSVIRNNRPHWIAPKWLDPAQVPRMNQVHDPPRRE